MSWEKLSEKQQAAAGAAEETAQVVMGANEEVAESSEEAAEAAKAGADAQREALNSLQDKYEEFRSQLQADIENKISLFEAFDGGEDMTVEKMLENLKSQTEGLENWRDNLKTLADEVGTSITPEFYNAILEMGPEAANAVQHMVDTLNQSNGRELLMELAKEYGDAMDFSDEMSDSMARVETVLDTALDMISNAGSSAFDDLASAMDDGVKAIEAEGGSVSQATRDAFLQAVDEAKAVGAEIPEGLAESIASGETSIEEATAQLNGSVKGQLEGLKEAAREAGIEISPEIAAGLEAGGSQALEAIQALIDQFNAKKEELGQAGKDGADQYTQQATASIEEGSGSVSSAAQDVGTQIMESAADGVSGSSGTLNDAVTQAMQSALNSALGYQGGFTSAGYFMSSGVATGITQGRSLAINAAIEMARQALAGAKQELEIKSPSRKFKRELGEQIGKGAAWGIKTSTKDAKKSAKEMSKEVLASATEWMEEYQLSHKVSLEDEKYFWQQVKKETKKGTEAYKQASKEISRISQEEKKIQDNFGVSRTETKNKKTVRKSDKEYYSEILQEARTYLDNKKVIYDISLREEEAYWTAVSKQLKRGTQAWYDAQKELKNVREDIKKQAQEAKEAQKEAAQEAREALVSEGETYVSRQRLKGSMDDGQELAYWKNVKSQLKRGTDEWWEVYEKIKDLEGDIAEAEEEAQREREEAQQELMDYALSGNALEDYKTYFKVSAQAEVQYWETVRKKFKEGTEERIEADKKYFEAKEELNEQLKELEEDYADKVKEVNEQMESDIKDLTDAYEDAVKDTADSIRSATGLFDAFESESVDGATLIYNLKTQVIGIQDWREQLQKLKDKGLDQGLIDELTAMGPEISATLHILNNDRVGDMGMTDEQLEEYEELWKQLNELTEDAAKEQNEILRKETEQKIADIQASAQLELATYKAEYESASAELTETISQPLETLATQMGTWGSEAVANYIAGIETGTEKGKTQVSTAVSQISSDFSGAAGTAGSNVSKEFASGVTASIGDINTSMGNVRNNVMSTLDQLVANGKTSGKNLGSGLAAGIRSSIKDVKEASKESVDSVISTIKKIGKINSPSKLTEEEAGIYFPAGIGQGIKKNKKAATEPAKDMVRSVLEAAQVEMDKGNMSLKARMENINFSGINRLNALMDTPIQTSITANINNSDLLGVMNQMLVTMQAFMDQEANKQIMLDKDTVVGELQPGISQTSAQKSKKMNRGRY